MGGFGCVALAGCVGNGDDTTSNGDGVPGESESVETEQQGPDPDSDVPEEAHEHLRTAHGYDGSFEDKTDEETVLVVVGAGDEGLAFLPAAIRIETGTTVEWSWSGSGGDHDVAARPESDAQFDSGEAVDEAGTEFTHAFEEPGLSLYWCTPHRRAGMRGAIEVVDAE